MPKNTFQLPLTAKLQHFEVGGIGKCTKVLCTFRIDPGSPARRQHRQIGQKSSQTPKSSENQRFRGRTSKYDFSKATGSWRLNFFPVADLGHHFRFLTFPSSHYSKMFSYYLPSWMATQPARSSKSWKSWILLADFIFWFLRDYWELIVFLWGLLKCLWLHAR